MSTARQLNYSYEDYLRIEENSPVRHEYLAGEVYAMAGGSPERGALALRAARVLGDALPGCTPLSSDVRIHVGATGLTTYPDVSFCCGKLERTLIDRQAITNPTVVVEVTSPSTEAYDRGEKLNHYRQLEKLEAIVLVSHREARITVVERSADGWRHTDYVAGERALLSARGAGLTVDDVYAVLADL
ncbi:MAG: Uma2 family endonuclease [Myxococcota bacterium]